MNNNTNNTTIEELDATTKNNKAWQEIATGKAPVSPAIALSDGNALRSLAFHYGVTKGLLRRMFVVKEYGISHQTYPAWHDAFNTYNSIVNAKPYIIYARYEPWMADDLAGDVEIRRK